MSETKHTPGPWEVRTVSDCAAIAQVAHMPHATVYNRSTEHHALMTKEDHANAALIAAAPELLAALELVENEVGHDSECPYHHGGPCGCYKAEVSSAIAKATGL